MTLGESQSEALLVARHPPGLCLAGGMGEGAERKGLGGNLHAVGVHGLADVELIVLEVGKESVLDERGGTGLELLDRLRGGALLLELRLDGLHVAYD